MNENQKELQSAKQWLTFKAFQLKKNLGNTEFSIILLEIQNLKLYSINKFFLNKFRCRFIKYRNKTISNYIKKRL